MKGSGHILAKRKTVITVETHSLTIMQTRGRSSELWCATCQALRQMMTVEQAASLCSINQRVIFRLVESNRVHFNETPTGQLLLCTESLRQLTENLAGGESA